MSADAKSTRAERGGSGKSTRTKLQVPTKSERAMRQPSCQSHPQPERSPLLDERVPALLIDATESVTAAIASATTKLSYREAHQAMAVNCEKKRELIGAIQELVDKHRTFFTVNKAVIEFGVAWAGVHAAHIDKFFAGTDREAEQPALLPSEALFLVIVVLAPLLIFAVVSIVQHTRRE